MENTRRGFLATAAAALAGVGLFRSMERKQETFHPPGQSKTPRPSPQSPCWNCNARGTTDAMGAPRHREVTTWFGPEDPIPYQPAELDVPTTIFPFVQAPCPVCRPLEWKGFLQGVSDPKDREAYEWYAHRRSELRVRTWGRPA